MFYILEMKLLVLGLGEMMNFSGVVNADDEILDKIMVAYNAKKIIDGHCPDLVDSRLDAYAVPGIRDEHECTTPEDLKEITCYEK